MYKKEFIKWITDLGFTKTWDSKNEYSMIFDELGAKGIFGEKLYFVVEDLDVRIYYSNFKNSMSYGSNLGYLTYQQIGEFERSMILTVLMKHFDEIPPGFKEYIRDSKIKNILED